MHRLALAALALALCLPPGPAEAAEVAGVQVAEQVRAGGKTLALNGAGLRKKLMFKVYVIGLYVERPTRDGGSILAEDGVRHAWMQMMLALDGEKIGSSIGEAFAKNPSNDMAALDERLTRFKSLFPDAAKGDSVEMTYTPGSGTRIVQAGKELGTIPGKDFADALFGVWIGEHAVAEDLRAALLGG